MAINSRCKFWFGTESYADWFATPLQGADSSPSAWGADGTLLNGGGWALNSWGSHKRYTYEWPASSSRETAQKMKSYRDGTYGRGLLYFLEPTIFTTNVLPAHWADPSMSLDNEAPSLVYGVDPVAVQTSGGANLGLPVTSAQYDLSNVTPQTVPTPDSSVFIPIPTGHTLFLGAFYSSTGTGGVFATPVNGNGTLGTAVKLTEMSNSDTDVVTDPFSGDLRGVRLWVGRPDGTTSTVTIAAMSGRLIESSDLPVYGPWIEQRRNLIPRPMPIEDNDWYSTNSVVDTSLTRRADAPTLHRTLTTASSTLHNVTLLGPGLVSYTDAIPIVAGETYTASVYASASISNYRSIATLAWADAAGNAISTNSGEFTEGVTGEWQRPHVTAVAPDGAAYALPSLWITPLSGNAPAGSQAWATDALMEVGSEVGEFIAPGVEPDTDLLRVIWTGDPNESESVFETRSISGNPAKEAQLKRGPWIGGQGHSGCRFLGTPTYVTNSPIEGGRIGFAATFVETGAWAFG